jgi:flagellar hook protein FlgE
MSFQQGLSGLNATSKNLEVIGNNVANANTYGAKSARAEFSDFYAAALNGAGGTTSGIGTQLTTIAQQFTQGSITATENPMDLAINGKGFFQVSDGRSPSSYTRNGQFKVDRQGYIVNNAGYKLMGYAADATGQVQPGHRRALQLPTAGIEPRTTTAIEMEFNLDANDAVTFDSTATPAIDFDDADTYNDVTSLTVFDAKGMPIPLTFYFQRVSAFSTADGTTNSWNIYVTANGVPLAGAPDAPAPSLTIDFPEDGKPSTSLPDPLTLDIPETANEAGATALAITGIELDLSTVTQFASPFGVTNIQQDGYTAGQLVSIAAESNGIVTARYSNGQTKPAGQIEIANFRNMQGLQPIGNNMWVKTYASGDPVVGVPGDGNLGVLQSGALEESNVDLTAELVNMITAQRTYQANAQTIKTMDQVLQTLVNLR